MKSNNIYRLLTLILAFILILLLWKGCQIISDRNNLITQVSNYQLGEKQFKIKFQQDSSTIATQSQTILTQDEAIRLGLLKLENDMKDVKSQVSQRQGIKIDSVPIPFIPGNYVDTSGWYAKLKNGNTDKSVLDSLFAHAILVPQKFQIEKKWYSIAGQVKKEGVLMDSIKIDNESTVTIGYKKSGFLNLGRTPVVDIKNTNPFLKVEKMNNVVIKPNKSIFNSKLFWAGIGLLGGIALSKF